MTSEEMHTALYEKFCAEQDNYRAWLLKQPPEEILRHSYEYAVREDIVMMMEDAELSPQQAAALRSAPVYPYPCDYAVENDELDKYLLSRKASIACKEAIEQAIGEHYADNRLDTAAAVQQVVDAFGYDRTLYVLAVTVKHKDWDGRISQSNKQWAASMPVFENKTDGSADQNVFLVVDKAHPGLTDLFVREARKAQAREKELAQQKPTPKRKGREAHP